jgi:predicted phosphodiesterase
MPRRRLRLLCLGILALAAGPRALPALELTRGPAIGRPDDRSVAVSWTTDAPSTSRVDYAGPDGTRATVSNDARVQRHVLRLAGLAPGIEYRYQIFSDDIPLGGESGFRAPRSPGETRFRFGVVGDTATVSVPAAIAARFADADPDLVLHMGDVVYPAGSEALYDQEFFRPFAAWLARGPVLPTLGNHDARTDRGAPMLANFVMPRNDATGDSRFYAFRQGIALFVCLDVETSAFGSGSPQYEWLLRTLAGTDATWKIVYFHEPPFSSDHSNVLARLVLSAVFERYGVDVVFSGHAHLYERTIPIRMYAASGPGIVYITEGGGGAILSTIERIPESAFVEARFSYLLGDVDGARLTLSAWSLDGATFDSVVLDKPVPPTAPRSVPVPVPSRPRAGTSKKSR